MQSSPEFEKDHPQVQYVKVAIPYKRVFLFLAIAVALQAAVAAVGVYLFNTAKFTDVCTAVAAIGFMAGSFMWGKHTSADAPMDEYVDKDTRSILLRDSRETSLSSQFRGGLIMLSCIVFALSSAGLNWLLQS